MPERCSFVEPALGTFEGEGAVHRGKGFDERRDPEGQHRNDTYQGSGNNSFFK